MTRLINYIGIGIALNGWLFNALAEENTLVTVRPFALKLNYSGKHVKKAGVELIVSLELKGEKGKGIKEFDYGGRTRSRFDNLLLKDSNIKNFGPCVDIRDAGSDDKRTLHYYLSFASFPSPGARWLRLTGELPVDLLSEELRTPPVPLPLEKGTEVQTGIFKVVVNNVELFTRKKDGKEIVEDFKYGIEVYNQDRTGRYLIKKFKLTDAEGNPVEVMPILSEFSHYYFTGARPDDIYVSVPYHTIEDITVPVDVRFDLYSFPQQLPQKQEATP